MEYWDIYDINKNRTGRTMRRNDWTMKPGDYHLTVLGAIRHPDGRFLITKRVGTKAWAPGQWEIQGGGVKAGEESREAINREILEETGMDVSGCPEGLRFTYRRDNPGEGDHYFVDVYCFTLDFEESMIRLQPGEAEAFRLASPGEIRALGEEGMFLHYQSIRELFDAE